MKNIILKNGRIVDPASGTDSIGDIGISDGKLCDASGLRDAQVVDVAGKVVAPGFIDLHVHLRQPGNTHAETIRTGCAAAAAGGFTSIVAMPNTKPAADTPGAIELLRATARKDGIVHVLPSGCMTVGGQGTEMAPIGGLKGAGVVAITDDGKCIQDHLLMRHVVEYAKSFGLPVLDHCEDNCLVAGGVMHEGKWSVLLGFSGMSGAAEELMIARDIILARETGWPIHMQHVSVKEGVELLRIAHGRGIAVTGEATPHHLTLTDECIKRFDTNYKMNPPLRSEEDRKALVGAVIDGTICAIATDHAPHTRTAKLVEFDSAPFGIIGLETAFSVSYTELVKRNGMPLLDYVARLTTGPASVLRMESYGLAAGAPADVVVFDPEAKYTVDSSTFRSMARNTPFDGMEVTGRVERTFVDGRQVYGI